jgi:hypothetical protein
VVAEMHQVWSRRALGRRLGVSAGRRHTLIPRRTASPLSELSRAPRCRDATPRHAFEFVLASVLESEPRSRDEVLHRGGDEHLRAWALIRAPIISAVPATAVDRFDFARVKANRTLSPRAFTSLTIA